MPRVFPYSRFIAGLADDIKIISSKMYLCIWF